MKFKDAVNLLEEEEIGYLGTIDNYRISVEGSEGAVPHIHCVKGNPKHPEKVSCLSLLEVGYANHADYHVTLSGKTFKHICNFLKNGYAHNTRINAWLKAVSDWNDANHFKIPSVTVNPYNEKIIY